MSSLSILVFTVLVAVYGTNAAALYGYGNGPTKYSDYKGYGMGPIGHNNYGEYGIGYGTQYGRGFNKAPPSEYGNYKYGGPGKYRKASQYGNSYETKNLLSPLGYGYGAPTHYGYTPSYGYGYNKQPVYGKYNFGPQHAY